MRQPLEMETWFESDVVAKLNATTIPTNEYFIHCNDAAMELKDLFERCIANGDSTSCLLAGARFCGKSTLVRHVLRELVKEGFSFRYVVLSGLILDDDQAGMAEILRSINPQCGNSGNFGDLTKALRELSIPFFVILEEFELFAQRSKQSLLYCLFDACHSGEFPLVVVGETSRFNCIELLEKRVKSRFSQRIITMNGYSSFESFKRAALDWPFLSTSLYPFLSTNETVQKMLNSEWLNTRNPRNVHSQLVKALYSAGNRTEFEMNLQQQKVEDVFLAIAKELTPLCAGLLVCVKRLSAAREKSLTFEAVYSAYRAYVMANEGISPGWSVYCRAFEKLVELGLIAYASSGRNSNIPKEFRPISLCATPNLIDEYFLSSNQLELPTSLLRWAKSDT